jgi:hypothetical protein
MFGITGMESSRNSLLSTILMTLPLIVVPALALLRPPGPSVGLSTSPALASEELLDEDFWLVNEDKFANASSAPENQRTSDSTAGSQPDRSGKTMAVPARSGIDPFLAESDSVVDPDAQQTSPQPPEQVSGSDAPESVPDFDFDEMRILEKQLLATGAVKIFWFSADAELPVGVAVFFPTSEESVQLRFDAVAESRKKALADVVAQVQKWQGRSTGNDGAEFERR